MGKKTAHQDSYTEAPVDIAALLDRGKRINDPVWLPHPAELARIRENKRVTINITRRSYEVLSQYAQEHHIPYQAMIRDVLDAYAERLEEPANRGHGISGSRRE